MTLTVLRSFDKPTQSYRLKFSGTISGAEGEDVTVTQQTCGYSFSTAVAGGQSRSGGFWDAEPPNPALISLSATYRARWKNEVSEPVAIRPEIPLFFFPIPKGRFVARVTDAATFKLPQRGWTLRAKVPAKTAAPCFKPNATEKLKS